MFEYSLRKYHRYHHFHSRLISTYHFHRFLFKSIIEVTIDTVKRLLSFLTAFIFLSRQAHTLVA